MLMVIGSSFSAEYILKGIYENTIGRFSEWTSSHHPVEEDQYAYKVAREYGDFVHIRPFYEFHFAHHIKGLWSGTNLWGSHIFRKWERKLFLSLDFTVEAFYCWLIEKATHASYGFEPSETYVWIENADPEILQQLTRVKQIKQVGAGAYIVKLPRYQEFTSVTASLVEHDIRFVEIAGNSQVLVSVIAPQSWKYTHSDAQQLFSIPILTHPESQRFVLNCDITSLHSVLNSLGVEQVRIEHLYDY